MGWDRKSTLWSEILNLRSRRSAFLASPDEIPCWQAKAKRKEQEMEPYTSCNAG